MTFPAYLTHGAAVDLILGVMVLEYLVFAPRQTEPARRLDGDEHATQVDAREAQVAAVEEQLAICESSDWFWWFGDYNPSAAVASFDSLYRRNLARLYRALQLEPPAHLDTPICAGSTTASGGSMRRVTVPSN